jgi:hypothetical protein
MRKEGVEKARKRLALAYWHLDDVRTAKDYDEFEAAWYRLLVAGNSVDGILQTAASSDPQSRPWYGGKINLRKKDPLLSYMHQARNSDEHGIQPVTMHIKAGLLIGTIGGTRDHRDKRRKRKDD